MAKLNQNLKATVVPVSPSIEEQTNVAVLEPEVTAEALLMIEVFVDQQTTEPADQATATIMAVTRPEQHAKSVSRSIQQRSAEEETKEMVANATAIVQRLDELKISFMEVNLPSSTAYS